MKKKRQSCVAFGKRLRFFREKQGLSQEDFAEAVDMHRTYVGGIERGERNPTLTAIIRLARGLNIEASDLMDFETS